MRLDLEMRQKKLDAQCKEGGDNKLTEKKKMIKRVIVDFNNS
jgi:hypothetical protein